jgi:MFS family permease
MSQGQLRGSGYVPTLIAGCFAVFVSQVGYALSASILGTMQQSLNITGSQLTWITGVLATAVIIFELSFGVFGDIFGRKQLLVGGLVLMIVGEGITVADVTNVHVIWVGQAIAGIGIGALLPISLTMIAALAPDAATRSRSIALWAGSFSIGVAVTPITAGALASAGHWKATFWLPLALAIVGLGVSLIAKNSSSPEGRRLDYPGQATLIVGLVAMVWALIQGSQVGYGSGKIIAGFVIAAVFLIGFVLIELRSSAPLLHLDLFKNRAFAVTGVVAAIGGFACLANNFSMTMLLGSVAHISAVYIGILFLFVQLPAMLLVPLIGRLIHSVSPQWVLTAGFLFLAAAGYWASTIDAHTLVTAQGAPHDAEWVRFIGPMFINGIGFALTLGSFTAVAINTVPLRLSGMASATTNLLRDIGFGMGPVLGGAIYNSIANGRMSSGVAASVQAAGVTDPQQAGAIIGFAKGAGALPVNSLPGVPIDAAKPPVTGNIIPFPAQVHALAFDSLSHAFSVLFTIGGLSATVAAVLTAVGLIGAKSGARLAADLGTDVVHEISTVADDLQPQG